MGFKCNECGKVFPVTRMTDDKRMCKDCYIKWLETDFVKMRTEERDKKIKQLEAQVEKMKCCSNCKWSDSESKLVHPPCKDCNWDLDKWEIKEND